MSLAGHLPIPGTPIRGIGDVNRIASQAAEHARKALSISTGAALRSTISGGVPVLSPRPTSEIACFEICSCWRRRKEKRSIGPTLGVNWTCNAVLVPYWRDGTDGRAKHPDLYWQRLDIGPHVTPVKLYWSIEGPPFTPDESSTAEHCADNQGSSGGSGSKNGGSGGGSGSGSGSGGGGGGEGKHDWQTVLYPKYEIGQWVWCVFDYSAGVWRVIDAYDNLVRFRLKRPMVRPCA